MARKPKRISIDVDAALHREIKIISAMMKLSLKDYVLGAVALKLMSDKRLL